MERCNSISQTSAEPQLVQPREARFLAPLDHFRLEDEVATLISSFLNFKGSMKTAYALAFLGLLAILSPAADARRLLQDSTPINDNDILNFALNLEVGR